MLNIIQNTIGALRNSVNANFEFTVDTTKAGTASDKFQLPLISAGSISLIVDKGDNTSPITITAWDDAATLLSYSSSGVYKISIKGEVRGWQFNNGGDKLKLTNVSNCGGLNISNPSAFYGCSNMGWTATDNATVSSTTLFNLFRDCTLFNGNIGSWNTSSVDNVSQAFLNCSNFNKPIYWDFSNVTNMNYAFQNATNFNQDVSQWDITSVTSMLSVFKNVTLSTANYDNLLVGWESQAPNTGLSPNFGSSQYTAGGAAATARASLISNYGWTITDGGTA